MDLNGKTVVITGGARGLGRAMASGFGARGATLALLDLNPADLDQAKASLEAEIAGVKVHTFPVNVTDEAGVIAAMDTLKDKQVLEEMVERGEMDLELGAPPDQIFAEWESEPFAAASIE